MLRQVTNFPEMIKNLTAIIFLAVCFKLTSDYFMDNKKSINKGESINDNSWFEEMIPKLDLPNNTNVTDMSKHLSEAVEKSKSEIEDFIKISFDKYGKKEKELAYYEEILEESKKDKEFRNFEKSYHKYLE